MRSHLLLLIGMMFVVPSSSCTTHEKPPRLQAPPFSAADEQLFKKREKSYLEDISSKGRLESYYPVEAVRGAVSPNPLPVAQAPVFSPAALDRAVLYVGERSSFALLIWAAGKLQEERYFGAVNRSTPLVSKAFAKPLAAMAIGRAIELGAIHSVNQPVADFVSEWRNDPSRLHITIRNLLEMTSGLMPQRFGPSSPAVQERAYLHPRHDSVLVYEYPVVDAPGERFEYSNAASELIALVIERATGRRYAEFVGSELLRPIDAAGGSVWIDRPGGLAHSGCCMMLPARTWLRLGILLNEGGTWNGRRILPAEFVKAMRTGTRQNRHFGMGLWVAGPYTERRGYLSPSQTNGGVLHSAPYLDSGTALFDGNGNQVMYLIPFMGMVILRMGESPPVDKEWDNSFLPNLLIADGARQTGRHLPVRQSR